MRIAGSGAWVAALGMFVVSAACSEAVDPVTGRPVMNGCISPDDSFVPGASATKGFPVLNPVTGKPLDLGSRHLAVGKVFGIRTIAVRISPVMREWGLDPNENPVVFQKLADIYRQSGLDWILFRGSLEAMGRCTVGSNHAVYTLIQGVAQAVVGRRQREIADSRKRWAVPGRRAKPK
jgi:hypothetical protein